MFKLLNINDFDTFCFDLDGTIFIGDQLLPGAKILLERLRASGKKTIFITNSPTQTRVDCQKRLQSLGIPATVEEVITAPYVAASYFAGLHETPFIYIVGESALEREISKLQLSTVTNPLDATHVIVGLDRHFTYEKLVEAMTAVRNGAKLVITNPDPSCPVPGGFIPDTYSIAKAIEVAAEVTISENVGKPSVHYARKIEEKLQHPKKRTLIVGDRIETDILLGINHGFPTCLILTGATTKQQADAYRMKADYTIDTLECIGRDLSFDKGIPY